jgi:hypothetical protein
MRKAYAGWKVNKDNKALECDSFTIINWTFFWII